MFMFFSCENKVADGMRIVSLKQCKPKLITSVIAEMTHPKLRYKTENMISFVISVQVRCARQRRLD